MTTLLLIGLILALLVVRQPLLVVLLSATAYVHLVWGDGKLEYIPQDMWVGIDKEVILSIPLFVLCGGVMTRGSIARRLIAIMTAFTAPIPGGLAVACILSCAVFAAISGSSIVTMLAIGSVMYPALRDAGYDIKFSLGAITAAGTLGIVIPPSIPMIVYGLVTETSITDLFASGFGPGFLLTAVFTTYAIWVNRRMPTRQLEWRKIGYELRAYVVPFVFLIAAIVALFQLQYAIAAVVAAASAYFAWDGRRLSRPDGGLSEVTRALKEGIWAMLLPVILLGGIYTGWFTPTEAAAVALLYAILVEVYIHKEMRLQDFYKVVVEASKLGGSLFPVLAVALSLNLILTQHRVPNMMVEVMQQYISSPIMFILLINVLLLVVGCLMDSNSAILVLAPLLAPAAAAYGYGKVLFGIIMVLNLEIGFLTPPVGLNLIVAMSAFKQPFGLICRAALPFILLMMGSLALVIWQPWIAMWAVTGKF